MAAESVSVLISIPESVTTSPAMTISEKLGLILQPSHRSNLC